MANLRYVLTLLCLGAGAAAAEPDVLQSEERVVALQKPLKLSFTAIAEPSKTFLAFDGRLIGLDATTANQWRGGSMPCVQYLVNGKLLGPEHFVSFADPEDVYLNSGESLSWWGPYRNWRLSYSPDFAPFHNLNMPMEMGDYPYGHVFDITSLVKGGAENHVEFRHLFPHYPDSTLAIRNVRVLDAYERPRLSAELDLFALPDLGDKPVLPRTKHKVDYTAHLREDGAITITVDGATWVVTSRLSTPDGQRNGGLLGGKARGGAFSASNHWYRLRRTVVRHSERVEVRDELANLTDKPIAIRIGHEIAVATDSLWKTYLCGLQVPAKESQAWLDVHTAENPTAYVCTKQTGVGLMPRDKVFRAHISLDMRDGAYGIHDRHFALAPRASYTMRWDIYPTPDADYFAFVNAARRALGANYLVDGNMVIAHGHEGSPDGFSDRQIAGLVGANAAKYVTLSTISRLDEHGRRIDSKEGIDSLCHGASLLDPEFGKWNRHWLEQVINRYRLAAPDVKVVPYTDCFVCSQPDARSRYADSVAYDPNGKPQSYTGHGLAVMYPTLDNSYGRAMAKVFDYLLEVADGFYFDESSMYYLPGSGTFDWRDDIWDGNSCIMHLGSGVSETGATYKLQRKVTSSVLYTLDFRVAQLRKAKRASKAVWMNFPPMTDEEAALQSYRFVEAHSNTGAVYCHLTSPLSLGNDHRERIETDIGGGVRRKLLLGGLYLTYDAKYHTDGNVLQDMYPIHPIELHRGYVIGKDKIITCVPGVYGFGDDSALTVRYYDPQGFRIPRRDATAQTTTKVELTEGEMAIIQRGSLTP